MQGRSPPKHRHDGTSPLPLGMDWSPPPRKWVNSLLTSVFYDSVVTKFILFVRVFLFRVFLRWLMANYFAFPWSMVCIKLLIVLI